MDPISIATGAGKLMLSKAASSVSEKFVDEAWGKATTWISKKFHEHGSKVEENANKNAKSFLEKTGKDIKIIVENSKGNPVNVQIIENSFNNPDFSADFQEAVYASARTNSEQKHDLLARIIAEKVLSTDDKVTSLTASMAIRAVNELAPRHLYYLGLCALIYEIRPTNLPADLSEDQRNVIFNNWWSKELDILLSKVEKLQDIDFRHLVSVNCIQYENFIGRSLMETLKSGLDNWDSQTFIDKYPNGQKMKDIFDGLQKVTLTSLGSTVGVYVHDNLTGITTRISW